MLYGSMAQHQVWSSSFCSNIIARLKILFLSFCVHDNKFLIRFIIIPIVQFAVSTERGGQRWGLLCLWDCFLTNGKCFLQNNSVSAKTFLRDIELWKSFLWTHDGIKFFFIKLSIVLIVEISKIFCTFFYWRFKMCLD